MIIFVVTIVVFLIGAIPISSTILKPHEIATSPMPIESFTGSRSPRHFGF